MKNWKKWMFVYAVTAVSVLSLVYFGGRAVTVIAESSPVKRAHCIVIDPGHGGEDGGATSCTGRLESTYNLEIALKLNDLLHLLGYDTRMIRQVDTSIYISGDTIAQKKISDLKERVRITNETPGALLLSIHQNQFPDPQYSGAQVFYGSVAGSEPAGQADADGLCLHAEPRQPPAVKEQQGDLCDGAHPMSRRPCGMRLSLQSSRGSQTAGWELSAKALLRDFFRRQPVVT